MNIQKSLSLAMLILPSLATAQDVVIPQNAYNDTIYVQQANLTPSANPVWTSNIILSTWGIDTFAPSNSAFSDANWVSQAMNYNTNNISIGENYLSIGQKNITNWLNILFWRIFTLEGIFFQNASILPSSWLVFNSDIFYLIANSVKIWNVFELSSNLASNATPVQILSKLTLNTSDKNWFVIDDTPLGPLSSKSIISQDYAWEVASTRTIQDNAVWTRHFAPGSVESDNIQDSAVTTEKFFVGSVTSNKIAFNTIVSRLFASGAITSEKILNWIIDQNKIDTSSVQVRVKNTITPNSRNAIQAIDEMWNITPITVCLRPKNIWEKTNAWEVWIWSDPEWKKWWGPSCNWVDVKKSCPVCDSRTWSTKSTWQWEWNKKSEDSWQNCQSYCPAQCRAYSTETPGSCSMGQRTYTITTYTPTAWSNNYWQQWWSCNDQISTSSETRYDPSCPQPQNWTCGASANTCQGWAAYNSNTNWNTTTWMCPGINGWQPTSCSYTASPPPSSTPPTSTSSTSTSSTSSTSTSSTSSTPINPSPNPSSSPTPINWVCGSGIFTCSAWTVANESTMPWEPWEPIENTWSCNWLYWWNSTSCFKNVPTRAPSSSPSSSPSSNPSSNPSSQPWWSSSSKQIQCTSNHCTKSTTCQNWNTTIVKYTQWTQGGWNDASCIYSCNAPTPSC